MNGMLFGPRVVISVAVASIISIVVIGNVHLVYVAMQSRPDCVGHLKEKGDEPGTFRAAKSAC